MCDRDESVAEDKLSSVGCKLEYRALEECLSKTHRDWSQCQSPLRTFQTCFNLSKSNRSEIQNNNESVDSVRTTTR
jgi:hypothetical protein